MTDPMKSPTPLSEALDEETEKAMAELIQAGLSHGYVKKLAIADCGICQERLALARSRIRTLIEEARQDGARPWILATNIPSIFPGKPDVR